MNTQAPSSPRDEQLRECLRQQNTEDEKEEDNRSSNPSMWMRYWEIEEVADIKKSCQLPEKASQKNSTEALIVAAKEQVLSTRSVEA